METTQAALQRAWHDLAALGVITAEALVAAAIAIAISRFLRRWVVATLSRSRFIDPNVVALAGNAVVVATYVVGATVILSLFGGNWTAVIAAFGAATVAITLALQDVLRGFVAGIYLLVERPFAIGERIRVGEHEGIVRSIEFRTTVLEADSGEMIMVPNATVFAGVVTNLSTAARKPLRVAFENVAQSPAEFEAALTEAINGSEDQFGSAPTIDLRTATADGLAFDVAFALRPEADPLTLLSRLHARFPEATIRMNA